MDIKALLCGIIGAFLAYMLDTRLSITGQFIFMIGFGAGFLATSAYLNSLIEDLPLPEYGALIACWTSSIILISWGMSSTLTLVSITLGISLGFAYIVRSDDSNNNPD